MKEGGRRGLAKKPTDLGVTVNVGVVRLLHQCQLHIIVLVPPGVEAQLRAEDGVNKFVYHLALLAHGLAYQGAAGWRWQAQVRHHVLPEDGGGLVIYDHRFSLSSESESVNK